MAVCDCFVQIFSTREVDREDVRFPQNLPTFFFPHIFPQIAGEGPGKDEFYSVQWHSREDGLGWVPSVWVSTCSLAEDVLRRLSNSEVHFTALYFAAGKDSLYKVPGDFRRPCNLKGT